MHDEIFFNESLIFQVKAYNFKFRQLRLEFCKFLPNEQIKMKS